MNQLEDYLGKDLINYIEGLKDLLSTRMWENILLDCTKNELLILWLLLRTSQVNMTQAAEYINVPLNTATGIIARMEKRALVIRERSPEDKRIVTISMGEQGGEQIGNIMKEFMDIGNKLLTSFTAEEITLLGRMMGKLMDLLKEEKEKANQGKTIRKIFIE